MLRRFYYAIDTDGRAPSEFIIAVLGENESDKGTFVLDREGVRSILAARGQRDLMIDLEHLSLDRESRSYCPDAMAWARLVFRDGALRATLVKWTDEGRDRVETKKQRYVSPTLAIDEDGRAVELINVAITSLPALHNLPPLIAANQINNNGEQTMDPKLLEALGLPSNATVEQVLAAIAELQRKAAAMAEDEGAPTAADAADEAAETTEDAAEIAAEEEGDEEELATDDDEEEELATDDEDALAKLMAAEDDDEAMAMLRRMRAAHSLPASVEARLSRIEKIAEQKRRTEILSTIGKSITPAQRQWAREIDLETLESFAKTVKPGSPYPGAPQRAGAASAGPSDADRVVALATGLSPKDLVEHRKKMAARKGATR